MTFRYLRDPLFLICCASYCVNRLFLKPQFDSPFLRFWLNDLLLVSCALPVTLWIFRALNLRSHDRPPTVAELSWILIAWAVLFEWIGPKFLSMGTGDLVDLLMYSTGAVLAWACWNLPAERVWPNEL